MTDVKERRRSARRPASGTGTISLGQEPVACRIIDVSETGAQIRIDGQRASRNFVGKRASLVQNGEGEKQSFDARVVWCRPAVNGAYLGLERIPDEDL